MRSNMKSAIAAAVFAVFGILYAVFTNIGFERLTASLWTPLAIALYFLVFSVLLGILTPVIVKSLGNRFFKKTYIRYIAIVLAAIFLSSMLFEFLYEIESDDKMIAPDSYILMIDDSSSMESSDPDIQREKAVSNLIRDKSDSFNYAIYVFSNDVNKVRDMLPKSHGLSDMQLATEGGTAMFGCLQRAISDIAAGSTKATTATRVILLSDGYAGDKPLFKSKILKQYVERNIVISTIGLGSGVDEDTLSAIAEFTGGVYIHIDDATMLDTALVDASVGTSARNLLGFRGFCRTNTLHAILRILFMLIIVGLIYALKIYSYGKYYKPNIIITAVCCTVAAFLPEIALQALFWNDNLMRIIFCALIAVTIAEVYVKPVIQKEYDDSPEPMEVELDPTNSLDGRNGGFGDGNVNSLG